MRSETPGCCHSPSCPTTGGKRSRLRSCPSNLAAQVGAVPRQRPGSHRARYPQRELTHLAVILAEEERCVWRGNNCYLTDW